MWGDQAIGKLVKGSEPLKPVAEAFVDEEAGPEVMQKVQRRLQHFIDRKVATLFEPLLAMSRDEAITGLARGFAFRLVEALGILPRAEVADDVKSLDQEARGLLRKHGVRFGQFTIFQQLLLKPAPTRLRLVLWGLASDHAEFHESPPPGLVTIPAIEGAPREYYTNSGYRLAGARAIRIDMLERLADMLRQQDSRSGFEATADMLSITGMTLDQFADLMGGLGYAAEKGERPKVKAAPAAAGDAPDAPAEVPGDAPTEAPDMPSETPAETPVEAPVEAPVETPADAPVELPDEGRAEAAEPEIETFYTFTWAPRRRSGPQGGPRRDGAKPGGKPRGKGKPQGKGGPKGPRNEKPKSYSAKPERREKKIDPDNPFAQALAGLKGNS
jgi:ATP-dependent RNA helicase SUPV3L1/SUV3